MAKTVCNGDLARGRSLPRTRQDVQPLESYRPEGHCNGWNFCQLDVLAQDLAAELQLHFYK